MPNSGFFHGFFSRWCLPGGCLGASSCLPVEGGEGSWNPHYFSQGWMASSFRWLGMGFSEPSIVPSMFSNYIPQKKRWQIHRHVQLFNVNTSEISTGYKFLAYTIVPKKTHRNKPPKKRSGDGGSHPKPNGCGGWNLGKGGRWRPWWRLGVWHVNSI